MKKLLLTGAALFTTLISVNAQEIFSVDFSDTAVLTDWFNIDGDGDQLAWEVNTEGFEELVTNGFTGGVALSASYDNDLGPLTPDNSLVTQAFTVPANGATLTYKIGGVDPDYSLEHYAVYVIQETDLTEDTTIADFTALLDGMDPIIEETLTSEVATEKTGNLSAYVNQSVRIVFRHYDITDQFVIVLDDVSVTEGSVAGLDHNLSSKLSLFPNPADNIVNVTSSENILINNVSVIDINGRTVKTVSYDGISDVQINISDLASGMYIMKISSDTGNTTKKLIKN